MGRSIKAGEAYVDMTLKDDQLGKGLMRSKQRIQDWGQAAADIGAGFTGAGKDISDFINSSVSGFATFGTKFAAIGPKSSKDLKQLKEDLASLDVTPTDEAVEAAKNLDSAMTQAKNSASALSFEIGSILSNEVSGAAGFVTKLTTATIKWLRANQEAAGGVVKVAAGAAAVAVGVGTAASAVGQAGHVIQGIGHAAGAIAMGFGGLVNPITLTAAALGVGAYAWLNYTESGQAAAAAIGEIAGTIFQTVKETFGGISDAIAGGDLGLAATVAFAGLKVAALQGVVAVAEAVGGVWGDFIGQLGSQIAGGDFMGAWATGVEGMAALWDSFANGVVSAFAHAASAIARIWKTTTESISNWLLKELPAYLTPYGRKLILGADVPAETQRHKDLTAADIENTKQQLKDKSRLYFEAMDNGGTTTDATGREVTQEDLRRVIDELQAKLARLQSNPGDFLGNAVDIARREISGTEKGLQSALAAYKAAAAENAKKSKSDLGIHVSGGVDEAKAALDKAQAEFAEVRQKAADAADAAKNKHKDAPAALSNEIFGSFSGAALRAAGGGGSPILRVAAAAEKTWAELQKQNEKFDATVGLLGKSHEIDKQILGAIKDGGLVE